LTKSQTQPLTIQRNITSKQVSKQIKKTHYKVKQYTCNISMRQSWCKADS